MKILFLTNNPDVSDVLYKWLLENGEDAIYSGDRINEGFIRENAVDFLVSYNYNYIIKRDVLDLLPRRAVNLHISYLPYNKGIYPNIWSFIDGTPAGVTIHEIDEGIDTGGILLQRQVVFDPDKETLRSSYNKLHKTIQELFTENWDAIKLSKIEPVLSGGRGTMHTRKDAAIFAEVLDFDDKAAVFLKKLQDLNPH